MKLTFLLGSGVSIPAGLPNVGEITKAVISGDGLIKRPAGQPPDDKDDGLRRVAFLKWIEAISASRYEEICERTTNYEDLAYVAGQIADDIRWEYENPAIHPLVEKATAELSEIFQGATHSERREQLACLAISVVDYIRQVVTKMLSRTPTPDDLAYLQFFSAACRDPAVTSIDIFTLNHDTLLENFLRNEMEHDGIPVIDGLRTIDCDGTRRWDHQVFDEPKIGSKSVKVFKLHGSVNWCEWESRFGPKNCKDLTDRSGCFIGHYGSEVPRGGLRHGARILVGTFNKILKYQSGVFLELHHRFHRALENPECKTLIVCGYGFSDKGVNTRIVEWRRRVMENRILIIDPSDSQNIYSKARGAIQCEIKGILDQTESGGDPQLDIIREKQQCGPVKHLKEGVGKRPDEKIKVVAWSDVKSRISGTDSDFVAA